MLEALKFTCPPGASPAHTSVLPSPVSNPQPSEQKRARKTNLSVQKLIVRTRQCSMHPGIRSSGHSMDYQLHHSSWIRNSECIRTAYL
jgi:hypothetical protein